MVLADEVADFHRLGQRLMTLGERNSTSWFDRSVLEQTASSQHARERLLLRRGKELVEPLGALAGYSSRLIHGLDPGAEHCEAPWRIGA